MEWAEETNRNHSRPASWSVSTRDELPAKDRSDGTSGPSSWRAEAPDPRGADRDDREGSASNLATEDATGAKFLRFWLFVDGRPVACAVEVNGYA